MGDVCKKYFTKEKKKKHIKDEFGVFLAMKNYDIQRLKNINLLEDIYLAYF